MNETTFNKDGSISEAEAALLHFHGFTAAADASTVYFLKDYSEGNKELESLNHKEWSSDKIVMAVPGMDYIASKHGLADAMNIMWGTKQPWTPKTFCLIDAKAKTIQSQAAFQCFLRDLNGTHLLLKKNIQRQQGIKVIAIGDAIQTCPQKLVADGYIVAQAIVENPLIFYQRKINFRYYILVLQKEGAIKMYVHHLALLNYASATVMQEDVADLSKTLITSAYIDRVDYDALPLDANVYFASLPSCEQSVMIRVIHQALQATCIAVAPWILHDTGQATYAQIFGADVQVGQDGTSAHVLEFNKSPDFSFWNARDAEIKVKVVHDFFAKIGIASSQQPSNLTLLWSSENGDIGCQTRHLVSQKLG